MEIIEDRVSDQYVFLSLSKMANQKVRPRESLDKF